jgi:hypothetical protein
VIGLTARTGGGSGEVVLTWTQNPEPDVVKYVVLRADTPGGSAVEVGVVTRAQVEDFVRFAPFVDVPVRVGYYSVRAIDASGNRGPRSKEICGASPGNSC